MSPLASVASGANILLATGPFVLPLGYCNQGYALSLLFMLFSMGFGYICFEFVLEAFTIASALRQHEALLGDGCDTVSNEPNEIRVSSSPTTTSAVPKLPLRGKRKTGYISFLDETLDGQEKK